MLPTGKVSGFDPTEGYRIKRHDYALPDVELTADEAAAVLASRPPHPGLAPADALPDDTRLLLCHDYRPGGRPLIWQTTVGEQKRGNVQINARTSKEDFVAFRAEKDAGLAAPVLILPALQVNIRAGKFPPAESNGVRYLMIPVKLKDAQDAAA